MLIHNYCMNKNNNSIDMSRVVSLSNNNRDIPFSNGFGKRISSESISSESISSEDPNPIGGLKNFPEIPRRMSRNRSRSVSSSSSVYSGVIEENKNFEDHCISETNHVKKNWWYNEHVEYSATEWKNNTATSWPKEKSNIVLPLITDQNYELRAAYIRHRRKIPQSSISISFVVQLINNKDSIAEKFTYHLICVGRPYTWNAGIARKVMQGEYVVGELEFTPHQKVFGRKGSLLGTLSSSPDGDANPTNICRPISPRRLARKKFSGLGNNNAKQSKLAVAVCENQGARRSMEDRHVYHVHMRLLGAPQLAVDATEDESNVIDSVEPTCSIFAVMDGHNGAEAAGFVADHVSHRFRQRIIFQATRGHAGLGFTYDIERALRETITQIENELIDTSCKQSWKSGCTAVICVIYNQTAVLANLGDSRAVLSHKGKAVDLTTDQNFKQNGEVERVKKLGATVEDGYLNGLLGVSRAFGNFNEHTQQKMHGLSAEPEFSERTLLPEDEFIVLACDGVWDVLSSQDAVNFVRSSIKLYGDEEVACTELVEEAIRRGSSDNVTALVISFHKQPNFAWVEPDEDEFGARRPRVRPKFTFSGLAKLKNVLQQMDEK